MLDLLLPATDAGVFLQFAILITVLILGLWFTRKNVDLRRLVIGIAVLSAGLMAVRAIH